MASEKIKRSQTRGEEIANTISHGLGAVLAAADVLLRDFAAEHLAALAVEALIWEVDLTPKPGLVDREGLCVQLSPAVYRLGGLPRRPGPEGKEGPADHGPLLHFRPDPGDLRAHVPAGGGGPHRLDAVSDQHHPGGGGHRPQHHRPQAFRQGLSGPLRPDGLAGGPGHAGHYRHPAALGPGPPGGRRRSLHGRDRVLQGPGEVYALCLAPVRPGWERPAIYLHRPLLPPLTGAGAKILPKSMYPALTWAFLEL